MQVQIGIFSEISTLIGVREDVDNVLTDINTFLADNLGQTFVIGEGPDGPTATWRCMAAPVDLRVAVIMGYAATELRRKLDIAAHTVY